MNELFEQFWLAYPKRAGDRGKGAALTMWIKLSRAKIDPQKIIAGAKRYAELMRDKINTPYIPQAAKWLRSNGWIDDGEDRPMIDDSEFARLKAKYDAKIARTA